MGQHEELMMKKDFIKLTSPTSIENTRKEVGGHMPTSPSRFKLRLIVIRMMFFLQEMTNIGGIQVPFIVGIQTPIQLESMFTWGTTMQFQWMQLLALMTLVPPPPFSTMIFSTMCKSFSTMFQLQVFHYSIK